MVEASKHGISAASLLTKLVENHMFGEKKEPVIHQEHDIEDNQVDIESWLAAHGQR